MLIAVFVFVFLSFSCNIALAEIEAGTFTLNPNVGWYAFDGDQNINDAPVYGIGLGYNYTEHLDVEGAFNYVYTDSELSDDNVRAYIYRVDGLYHFMPEKQLVPYLAAGIGAITLDDVNGNDTNGLFNYGAGLKYFMSKSLAVRGDVRHLIDFDDSNNNFAFTIGFSYVFGAKEQAPPLPSPKDSDGDGIYDDVDECPDTPAGVAVDSRGCPKDSDGDGVYDYMDKCPDTPAGVSVDSVGCPEDSDGDGVYDYMDKCPDTPAGVPVDSAGCPKDSDGDGVYDYMDKCPDTPLGIKVDDQGCPLPIKEKVSIDLNVQFDFDRAVVKEGYYDHINKVVKFLETYPEISAVIEGHTCNIGTEEYNMGLSRRRAESVMKHMVDSGIDPARLKAVGYGESMPIADNNTREGRERNRRVEAEISTVVIKLQ
jgi:OOP family OmpA-OmpF porin